MNAVRDALPSREAAQQHAGKAAMVIMALSIARDGRLMLAWAKDGNFGNIFGRSCG